MIFTWDENKNRTNIKKHGIPFNIALRVFQDSNRVESYDDLHDEYEDRYKIIGMVGKIITVIVTYREND